MEDACAADRPPASIEFAVDPRRIRGARIAASLHFLLPVGLYYLASRVEGGMFPGISGPALWIALGVSTAFLSVPVFIGIYYLRRVPRGAADGRIRIDAEGIDYRIGTQSARVAWSEVGGVRGVPRRGTVPAAIWLARVGHDLPGRKRLAWMLGHRLGEPVYRKNGTLLPLGLFEDREARSILASATEYHAAAAGPPRLQD